MQEQNVSVKPQFNPAIKTYFFLLGLVLCLVTVVGWVLLPFWILGLGQYFVRRYYSALSCELSDKVLHFKKGILWRVEKSIPLENIQDLTFRQGLFMRMLGLSILEVETAGGQGNRMGGDLTLIGIVNPLEFREVVLAQREKRMSLKHSAQSPSESKDEVLKDIASTLKRIEQKLSTP
jgi:putative membrane protein